MQGHQFVLTYWNIRGTTQALRYLLQYIKVDYEDRAVEWPEDRQYSIRNLVEFPRMPNLNHNGFEVTEIIPIGKYICRKAKKQELLGKTLRDQVMVDSFIGKTLHARDIYLDARASFTKSDQAVFQKLMFQKTKVLRETFLYEVDKVLSARDWYIGYLTIADFILYNVLKYYQVFVPGIIAEGPTSNFLKRFESLEPLREYFKNGKGNYPYSMQQFAKKDKKDPIASQ